MDYTNAMRTVADLIENRHLDEARSLLRLVLVEYPDDKRAQTILQYVEKAAGQPDTDNIPTPDDFHAGTSARRALKVVRKAISQIIDVPWRDVPVDERLSHILGMGELSYIELVLELEDRFDVEIDPMQEDYSETVQNLRSMTVREIADWISAEPE